MFASFLCACVWRIDGLRPSQPVEKPDLLAQLSKYLNDSSTQHGLFLVTAVSLLIHLDRDGAQMVVTS